MKYLIFIILLSGCATTGKNCDRYQAIEDCQMERNDFFNKDFFSEDRDDYSYCEQIVPQCE